MANVYDGPIDTRQASEGEVVKLSRFRPKYRALTDEEKQFHDALKTKASELEDMFNQLKPGRYSSLAMTSLEQALMWAVKELTS